MKEILTYTGFSEVMFVRDCMKDHIRMKFKEVNPVYEFCIYPHIVEWNRKHPILEQMIEEQMIEEQKTGMSQSHV